MVTENTTDVHVLTVHWIGDDNDCTATYAGWTEDAAWDAFLQAGREDAQFDLDFALEHGDTDDTDEARKRLVDYASRAAFAAAYGPNDVYIGHDRLTLPAR